ncbi:AAA family ATPase [Anaerobaca lacustris]|uniref:AAA family ATPase n=1 Tax=Anaerobaca lacustris TaxID=3044600 RepID=A0AAW6U2P8_9BACT|nr:AAA family ATPase [Sedimentisphaerales bacterium M17dextr]
MRIKDITLAWFRGAADPVSLNTKCASMLVYGENGSGKSSFVDAVEYVLKGGKIGHLSHEYSGKRQERAILNTHRPETEKTRFAIRFQDDSELKIEVKPDGSSACSGAEAGETGDWEYRRTVLRQDEVTEFIHDTKGNKYSALLPLLGLGQMELAAENLRQLAKFITQESKLREVKSGLEQLEQRRKSVFGCKTDEEIAQTIQYLHGTYCSKEPATQDPLARCEEVATAIDLQMSQFTADQQRYLALHEMGQIALVSQVVAVRTATNKLVAIAEPLLAEKLAVLESTVTFAQKLEAEKEVICPACGKSIPAEELQAHVMAETKRLENVMATYNSRKTAAGILCGNLKLLQTHLAKSSIEQWRDSLSKAGFAKNLEYGKKVDTEALRSSLNEEGLQAVEKMLLPLVTTAATDSKDAPPDVKQLSADKKTVEMAASVIEATEQAAALRRAQALLDFIMCLENSIREEIRVRSEAVIKEISADICRMWSTLHPGERIEGVRLYLPEASDKAIEIGLKFHGVNQDSPRLTLSEGYRNSLGLCIFLAMAKREAVRDHPLLLDDVVVSLDRGHRGMIVEVLEQEFSARQVLLFTHDRDWYAELRQQLDSKKWVFRALLPYETPDIGIRFSDKTTTFADARAHLKERPDSAGNDARKIMDIELALIAERLRMRMLYLRGAKNDKRMAHDFLERLIADGKKCFQKKEKDGYTPYSEALEACDKTDRLLISWANRGSHTFDLVRPEAEKLIDACENALQFFTCSSCGKALWFADADGPGYCQCQCGEIRWRYT